MAVNTFKHKKKSFKKFAESINFNTSTTYVWEKCKIYKNKWTKVLPTNVKSNLQNSECINSTLNRICPSWCETDPEYLPDCNDNQFFYHPFNFAEYNSILDSKKKKKTSQPPVWMA